MSALLYPVAANADLALSRPLGQAARAREAEALAGKAVAFVSEVVGPAFATQEAAAEAYAGRLSADGRFARLTEQVVGEAPGPVSPVFAHGRRWPIPNAATPRTAWRLLVAYWKVEQQGYAPQARHARRSHADLDADTVRALTTQPLKPVEPQQPLDMGLFEIRLPEAPHIVAADE